MSSLSTCPKCALHVTLPAGALPSEIVRCPHCQAEYALAEALANAPPALVLVRASILTDPESALAPPPASHEHTPKHEPAAEGFFGHGAFDPPADAPLGMEPPHSTIDSADTITFESATFGTLPGAGHDSPNPESATRAWSDGAHHATGADDDDDLLNLAGFEHASIADDAHAIPHDGGGTEHDLPTEGDDLDTLSMPFASTDEEEVQIDQADDLADFPSPELSFEDDGESIQLDSGDEAEAHDAAFAGAPVTAEVAQDPQAAVRPKKRKPSMLVNVIMMGSSVVVAALVAYPILMYFANFDPLKIANFLPAFAVPAGLAKGGANKNFNPVAKPNPQLAQVPPAAQNPANDDSPGFQSQFAPVEPRKPAADPADENADDAATADDMNDDSNGAKAAPTTADDVADSDDPSAADAMAADDAATDDSADEETAAPVAKTPPKRNTKPPVADTDLADDETADENPGTDAMADDSALDDTAADTAMTDSPAADAMSDDATEPDDAAPTGKPGIDAMADDATTDDTMADDTMADNAMPDETADVADATSADLPGDDVAAPEAKEPELAVGPRDGVHYTPDQVEQALAGVQDARTALAGAKEDKKVKAQYYRKLYELAEFATFAEDGTEQAALAQAIAGAAADRDRFAETGRAARAWLKGSQGKEHKGIVLAGSVQEVSQQGNVYATKVLLADGSQSVSVLTAHKPGVGANDKVLVMGSIVADPATTVEGYKGSEPVAVWSTVVVKAPNAG